MTIKIKEGTCVMKEEIHSEEMYNNVVKAFEEAGYPLWECSLGYQGLYSHSGVGVHKGNCGSRVFNLTEKDIDIKLVVSYRDLLGYKKGYSEDKSLFTEELHRFCEKCSLFYSFHVDSGFTIDVEELSYIVKTSEDWNKFKTMYVYHEELLEKL